MKYSVYLLEGGRLVHNLEEGQVEEAIRPHLGVHSALVVHAMLPIGLRAFCKGGTQLILENGAERLEVLRDTAKQNGYIGASCELGMDVASVQTLNIKFRDISDDMTDRGVVWVIPGEPSCMHLIITKHALCEKGLVTHIVGEARAAVEEKIIRPLSITIH